MTDQRTPEWHEARKGRLTGSQVGAALGFSPWQKPEQVLRAMVRKHHGAPDEFDAHFVADWGNNHEVAALLAFQRHTGLDVTECGFFPLGEFMGASPDGLTSDGGVLELKVPFSLRKGGEFKTLEEQPHYYAQAQFEIAAAGATHGYFAQYRAQYGDPFTHEFVQEEIVVERVEPDKEWWEHNSQPIQDFYDWYLAELDNKSHLEPLRVTLADDEHWQIVAYIDELDAAIQGAQERKKEQIDKLIEMADGKNADVCGRKLTKVVSRGRIAYSKLFKAHGISESEQDKFRGKESESWRFS